MREDTIKIVTYDYKETILKEAKGVIGNTSINLQLSSFEKHPYKTWVIVKNDEEFLYEPACFLTKFFANRYFNKMVKKYDLQIVNKM